MTATPISVREHDRRRAGVIAGRAQGWTLAEIAADLGLPLGTLQGWLSSAARDLRRGRSGKRLDTTGWEEKVTALRGEGLTWRQIARVLGVSRQTLQGWRHSRPAFAAVPRPLPALDPSAPACRVVVWGEWVTPQGSRPAQIGLLAPAQIRLRGSDLHQVWSVDCTTCHKAWIGDDEEDAHRIADAHLADRTQPSATRKEAPRAI